MDGTKKEFNHAKASASDAIRLIGELEHIRSHALRSATVSLAEDNSEKVFDYTVIAKRAQLLRRDFMRKHFGDIDLKDWCLCKSAACLRQIAYEIFESDVEELSEIDNLVDEIWGKALGKDLSDCEACVADMGSDIVEE